MLQKLSAMFLQKRKEVTISFDIQLLPFLILYPDPVQSVKTRETKRIYYIDNQLFAIFLYLVILPFFACFLLDSTLLVHFDIPNFLVSLQNKKTSENKRVNDFTRFDTHLGT